jgi:hypothetical protein
MARNGKIARLPLAVREELNERLRENENGQTILAWLNAHPAVKKVLADQFDGQPINDANLSLWRSGGFAEWLKDQDDVERVQKLQEVSMRLASASGGNLSKGLLALNVGRIQEALEEFWEGLRDLDTTQDGNEKDQAITRLLSSLSTIRGLELEEQKLDLRKVEVAQKGQALELETRKFNHLRVKSFIEWVVDEEAKKIATSDLGTENKLEALGRHLFGDAW